MNRPVRSKLSRIAVFFLAAVSATAANAEAIDLSAAPVPGQTILVWPESHLVHDFTSAVAGTVTLSVARVPWADLLSILSTAVAFEDRPQLTLNQTAQVMFQLGAGERFTTSVFARAGGPKGYGAYSLDISFLPSVSEVPLPAAGWLLLSALGVAAVATRRRAPGSAAPPGESALA